MASVCAMRANGPQWYATAAEAKKDKARIMHPGNCEAIVCMGFWPKVVLAMHIIPSTAICGMDPLTHAKVTIQTIARSTPLARLGSIPGLASKPGCWKHRALDHDPAKLGRIMFQVFRLGMIFSGLPP